MNKTKCKRYCALLLVASLSLAPLTYRSQAVSQSNKEAILSSITEVRMRDMEKDQKIQEVKDAEKNLKKQKREMGKTEVLYNNYRNSSSDSSYERKKQAKLNYQNAIIAWAEAERNYAILKFEVDQYDKATSVLKKKKKVELDNELLSYVMTEKRYDIQKDKVANEALSLKSKKLSYENGAISQVDYERANNQYERSKLDLQQAKNDLDYTANSIKVRYQLKESVEITSLVSSRELNPLDVLTAESILRVYKAKSIDYAKSTLALKEEGIMIKRLSETIVKDHDSYKNKVNQYEMNQIQDNENDRNLTNSIYNEYYAYKKAEGDYMINKEDLNLARKTQEANRVKFQQGQMSQTDYEASQLRLKDQELNFLQSQKAFSDKITTLSLLLEGIR